MNYYQAFNKALFEKHQSKLLWLFNAPYLRDWLGVPKSFKGEIVKVSGNSVHRIKNIYKDRIEYEMIAMVGQPIFIKQLYKIFNIGIALSTILPRFVLPIPRLLMFGLTVGDFPTGAGDGHVGLQGAVFATVRGGATGDTIDYTGADVRSFCRYNGANYFVYRGFFPADTSAIDDSATITAAELHTFLIVAPASSSVTFGIVTTTQASTSQLVADDYDNVGGTALGTFTVASTDSAGTEYTGTISDLSTINKTGVTKLGIRENTYDIGNSAPATNLEVNLGASENATSARRPFYRITYTIPTTFVARVMVI